MLNLVLFTLQFFAFVAFAQGAPECEPLFAGIHQPNPAAVIGHLAPRPLPELQRELRTRRWFGFNYRADPKVLYRALGQAAPPPAGFPPKRELAKLLSANFDHYFSQRDFDPLTRLRAHYYLRAQAEMSDPVPVEWTNRLVAGLYRTDPQNPIKAAFAKFSGKSLGELESLLGELEKIYGGLHAITNSPGGSNAILENLLRQEIPEPALRLFAGALAARTYEIKNPAHKQASLKILSGFLRRDGSNLGQQITLVVAQEKNPEIRRELFELLAAKNDRAFPAFLETSLDPIADPAKLKIEIEQLSAELTGSEVAKPALAGAAKKYLDSRVQKLNLAEAENWRSHFPEYNSTLDDGILSLLRQSGADAPELHRLTHLHQDRINSRIETLLQHYVQANAPPPPFSTTNRPWGSFLDQLPEKLKYDATVQLLNAQASSADRATNLIAQLHPAPGIREGVARFLADSQLMSGNMTSFSPEQVNAMFGGVRFRQFFSWVHSGSIDSSRTKLMVAVRTNPNQSYTSLNPAWVREKIETTATESVLAEAMGFRPVRGHGNLETQLKGKLMTVPGVNKSEQLYGLVVQGHYEKNGHTLFHRLNRERGQDQVEARLPAVMRALDDALEQGLRDEDPLAKRWLAYNWNMSTNNTLVENIRSRAVWIAEQTSGFYDLRVEIHNFPTATTLARIKSFLANTSGGEAVKAQLNAIITEITQLLGLDHKGSNLPELIAGLPTTPESKNALAALSAGFAEKSTEGKLLTIADLRPKWRAIKAATRDPLRTTQGYNGDRQFSDLAMAITNQALDAMAASPQTIQVAKIQSMAEEILRQVQLDELLTAEQAQAIKEQLSVISRAPLTAERKLELSSQTLQNAVDQSYYRLERTFGEYDGRLAKSTEGNSMPPSFVDSALRSQNTFMLSKLSDIIETHLAGLKKITNHVAGVERREPVQVFNPGERIGILRFNKPPMALLPDEIAVFERMPAESAPVKGFLTLGDGARLSHLQLLARSLKIPNAKLSKEYADSLKSLDGKWVRYETKADGQVIVEEVAAPNQIARRTLANIEVPVPNHSVKKPISFNEAANPALQNSAGPKGMHLAKMRASAILRDSVPDGSILPFGFFDRYAAETGLKPLLDLMKKIDLKNEDLVSVIAERIARHFANTKIPDAMLDEVMAEMKSLQERTGATGFFFRSDTNLEDLKGFNGAGLNESVANVPMDRAKVEAAIRQVWVSPFKEKSIYWRAQALPSAQVSIAEPSVVIMPTIRAESSGVIISRGGPEWKEGRGFISANWGIGSVVEAPTPVEEITLESGEALRFGLTVANRKPVISATGGLEMQGISPGKPVLSAQNIRDLNTQAVTVDKLLGYNPHGWDIEWAIDAKGKPWILQARPNE